MNSEDLTLLKLALKGVSKPWGIGSGIEASEALRPYSIAAGTGELWLASAQTGPGNYSSVVTEPALRKSLADVLDDAAAAGDDQLRALLGEGALAMLRRNPHRGKTEAWMVRETAGHTGVAAGPRTIEQRDKLKEMVLRRELGPDIENWPPDVRDVMGLIEPLRGGEIFFVPCGTLHTMFAIGPDSRLVIDEIQQGYGTSLLPTLSKVLMVQDSLLSVQVHPCDETVSRVAEGELHVDQNLEANPTVRVYDFGRRPGEYPELGFELTNVNVGLRRVMPVGVELEGGAILEVMVACPQFVRSRLTIPMGAIVDVQPLYGSYRVLHCLAGACSVEAARHELWLSEGETALVPGAMEHQLRIRAQTECCVFDDAVPDLESLQAFLSSHGKRTEALLQPPRALRE